MGRSDRGHQILGFDFLKPEKDSFETSTNHNLLYPMPLRIPHAAV
jgi:hypothetical protein